VFEFSPLKPNSPLINYDLTLLIQPLVFCGTMIGVLLNEMFPYWLTMIVMIIVTIFSVVISFKNVFLII
jgi:hypothetical protein